MKSNLIDFNKYYSPEEVKDYELFIGRDGEYYKVKTRYESDNNCTHYKWAEAYLEKLGVSQLLENEDIKKKCKTPLEVLVHYFGFIRYTHAYNSREAYLNIPNRLYFGYTLSKKQINSLYDLMNYNQDRIDDNIINQIENMDYMMVDSIHQKYRR